MVQREKIEPKVVVQPEMNFFTIGGDTHHDCRKYEIHHLKSAPVLLKISIFLILFIYSLDPTKQTITLNKYRSDYFQ